MPFILLHDIINIVSMATYYDRIYFHGLHFDEQVMGNNTAVCANLASGASQRFQSFEIARSGHVYCLEAVLELNKKTRNWRLDALRPGDTAKEGSHDVPALQMD